MKKIAVLMVATGLFLSLSACEKASNTPKKETKSIQKIVSPVSTDTNDTNKVTVSMPKKQVENLLKNTQTETDQYFQFEQQIENIYSSYFDKQVSYAMYKTQYEEKLNQMKMLTNDIIKTANKEKDSSLKTTFIDYFNHVTAMYIEKEKTIDPSGKVNISNLETLNKESESYVKEYNELFTQQQFDIQTGKKHTN